MQCTTLAQIGIVFSDVDGTLADGEHHPMPAMARVVQEVARRVPFCLVSARSPEGLYPFHRALGFVGPLACYSGAYVLDESGNELFSATIPTADACQIKEYLARELPRLTVGTYGFHHWIVDNRHDSRIQREEYLVQTEALECTDLAGTFGERGVHKFLLMGEPDDILVAEREVGARYPQLNVVRSSDILCEVMDGSASKSRAVRLLCAHAGVDASQAVAFGDGPNDLDMLEAVGRSYAMANAEPQVKEAATQVIDWTNEEGGVARQLELLIRASAPAAEAAPEAEAAEAAEE